MQGRQGIAVLAIIVGIAVALLPMPVVRSPAHHIHTTAGARL